MRKNNINSTNERMLDKWQFFVSRIILQGEKISSEKMKCDRRLYVREVGHKTTCCTDQISMMRKQSKHTNCIRKVDKQYDETVSIYVCIKKS